MRPTRFTLVELLVAVTVLSVLAALLLPALGQAVHNARMLTCTSNLHQFGLGAMTYALDHRNTWPARYDDPDGSIGTWGYGMRESSEGAFPQGLRGPGFDHTQMFAGYQDDPDALHCPFLPARGRFSDPTPITRGTYALYWGWQLAPGEPFNRKVGQEMGYGGKSFRVIGSDVYNYYTSGFIRSGHPDPDGVLYLQQGSTNKWARWRGDDGIHGPLDMSFLFDDLSATRLNDVLDRDDRLETVPYKWNFSTTTKWTLLPAR